MRFWLSLLLVCSAAVLWAETEVDRLFDEVEGDVVADTSSKPDLSALLVYPLKLTGAVDSSLLFASDGRDSSGGYSMVVDLFLDSRPSKEFRLYGDLETELSGGAFTPFAIEELFLDYTFADTVVFRAGKQTLSWGQGRILTPTDIVSDSDTNNSLKVSAPVFGQSLTLVGLGGSSLTNPSNPSWREFIYAAQLSGDLGPVSWGVAGRSRPGLDLQYADRVATAFLKTVLWSVDVFGEGMATASQYHYLTGFFWEGGDPKTKLWGELSDTHWGVAAKLTWNGFTPGIKWEHSRTDRSGELISGVEISSLPLATVIVGVPWIYGKEGTEYVVDNEDPAKRRWALGIKINLKASF